jgi:hypothetical protein
VIAMAKRAPNQQQLDMFEAEKTRALLDQLLAEARLYTSSKTYAELLDFVARLRNFAPFNAMLLNIQKPGLSYAATAADWRARFERFPKPEARPLLILWPFGPVALVYDVLDTEGKELPEDATMFPAQGATTDAQIDGFIRVIGKKGIATVQFDGGDGKAGSIELVKRAASSDNPSAYRLNLNRNHAPAVRFVTIMHELAHLFLSHLVRDKHLGIPERPTGSHAQQEIEAESVAYIIAKRNGIESKSQKYLSNFVGPFPEIDVYSVMRAAGQIEQLLGLSDYARMKKQV